MTLEISDMEEREVMISLSIDSCTRAMTSDAHQGLSQRSLPHIATHLEETLLRRACWLGSTLDRRGVHSNIGFRARTKLV
jgi:hypothetical protein